MPGLDIFVKIPKERVGILIGPEGKVKQILKKNFKSNLTLKLKEA